jgi:hypothetical protein
MKKLLLQQILLRRLGSLATLYPKYYIVTEVLSSEFAKMIENDYVLKENVLQAEIQTIGNIIWTFSKENKDEENPWRGILAAMLFATRATSHTKMQATPMQVVFGRDSILNTKFEADWASIRQ